GGGEPGGKKPRGRVSGVGRAAPPRRQQRRVRHRPAGTANSQASGARGRGAGRNRGSVDATVETNAGENKSERTLPAPPLPNPLPASGERGHDSDSLPAQANYRPIQTQPG